MRCSIIKVFRKLFQYFSIAGAGSLLWYKMRMIWLIQLASYFYPRLLVLGTFYLECFLSDNFHSVSLKIFLVFWINDSSRGFLLGTYIPTHTQTQIWLVNIKYLYAIISNMLLGKYYTISKIYWIFQKCIQVGSNRASQVAQWVKNLPTNAGDVGLIPGSGRISWSRKWKPIPIFLPGKSHRQRSLVGYSPRDQKSQTRLSN